MINVNVSSNLQDIQGWKDLAGMVKTGETTATGDVDVRIENDQIVVTVKEGDAMQYVAVSVPDLGAMDEVPDTEALQSIAAKILDLVNTLAAVGTVDADGKVSAELRAATQRLQAALNPDLAKPPAPGDGTDDPVNPPDPSDPTPGSMNTSKALFDLFALMALMVEVSQKQRDTSREIRLTENQQIQNSIKTQADEMRSAALIALGFGIATAIVSGVMSIAAMVQQARAFTQQTSATKQMDVPTQRLKAADLATTPEAAKANLAAVKAKTSDLVQKRVDTVEFNAEKESFGTKIDAADKALAKAEADQTKVGKELADLKAEKLPPDADEETKDKAAKAIAAKTKDYEDATDAVSKATAERARIEHGFFDKLDTRLRANDATIEMKETEIAAKETELKSKSGLEAQVLKDRIAVDKDDLAKLRQENAYLRATTTDLKAQYASEGMKNSDLIRAQNKYDSAKQQMQLSDQFAGSQQMMNRWMGVQQLTMTLSQMTNAAGNMIAEARRADATMEGVEQTQHNEQLDQIKDLFQQAETVVQAVVQLMQAVLSAENESLMEAIRA